VMFIKIRLEIRVRRKILEQRTVLKDEIFGHRTDGVGQSRFSHDTARYWSTV
jgi:hypothetical protein